MTVYLAVSYDTEHTMDCQIPSSIISPSDYNNLDKEQKKKEWVRYLQKDVWNDPEQIARSKKELDTIANLGELFAEFKGEFTSFILGRWLDFIVENTSQEEVQQKILGDNIEIGSHSYEHKAYLATGDATRDGISPPLEQSNIYQEIKRANETIVNHLGITPIGLRTPMGNLRPFGDKEGEILKALEANDIFYVSSWLKAAKTTPNNPGTAKPFIYSNTGSPGIMEIPGVGPYDVHGTQPTRLLIFDEETSWSERERTDIYLSVLEQALRWSKDHSDKPTAVPLVFHPWDVPHYDSQLQIHTELLRFCNTEGIEVVSYKDINSIFRE